MSASMVFYEILDWIKVVVTIHVAKIKRVAELACSKKIILELPKQSYPIATFSLIFSGDSI